MSTVQMQIGKPTQVLPATVSDGLLPAHLANHQWFFAHLPTAWEFDDTEGWLPSLAEIRIIPGVNGVEEERNSAGLVVGVKTTKLVAGLQAKGARIFNPLDPALGDYAGYLGSFPCQGGRKHYTFFCPKLDRGNSFDLLPNGHAVPTHDATLLTEFRKFLRDQNLCNLLHHSVVTLKCEIAANEADKLEQKGTDFGKRKAAEIRARIEKMRESFEKYSERLTTKTVTPATSGSAPGKVRLSPQKELA